MQQLTTIEELSEILRKTVGTIRADVSRNPKILPPILRVPGTRAIHFVDVEAWIAKHTIQATAEPFAKPTPATSKSAKQIAPRRQGRRATPEIGRANV